MFAALIPLLAPVIEGLVGLIPNENEREAKRAELNMKLLEIAAKQSSDQTDINKVEAGSASVFVSGWRPSLGWVGAFGYAYQFLFQPLFPWFVEVLSMAIGHPVNVPKLPPIDTDSLNALTMGMLGLGGFRTFEKLKGVAGK